MTNAPHSTAQLDLQALDESDSSDSEVELEAKIERPAKPKSILKKSGLKAAAAQEDGEALNGEDDGEEDDDEDDDEEEDIPLSDVDSISSDVVPRTRLTINNRSALSASLARIALPSQPFSLTQSHTAPSSAGATESGIPDVSDDVVREAAFTRQARLAAVHARAELRREGVPFSRPGDYFAEMLKADGHMEKVRGRLVEVEGAKRAAAEARRLRDAKKMGKQVQREKLQERARTRKMDEEKIRGLKRSTYSFFFSTVVFVVHFTT